MQQIIIVGAGIIGAASVYHLQTNGAQVTIIDAGKAKSTSASFGWINASFYANANHFQLRSEGILAYHRLCNRLSIPVNWSGCLCWENKGISLDTQLAELNKLQYDVEEIDATAFALLEPHVANPPERCLRFTGEGAAESAEVADVLLQAAIVNGAQIVKGVSVDGFLMDGKRVTGVKTQAGPITADKVLVAAGTGTEELMANVDIKIPMLHRPALVLKTYPVKPVIQNILVSEIGEVRQLPGGALIMPTTIGHQGDTAEAITLSPDIIADEALQRLQSLLPSCELNWSEITMAHRPVPQDNLPIVGQAMQGLYVATMHSGITLGALMGELIAMEIKNGVTNESNKWLAPYRPERFQKP